MSAGRFEFPEPRPSTREPRANRPDRKAESEGCVLVTQLHPRAKNEDLSLPRRQLAQQLERPPHAPLVVDALLRRRCEVRLGLCLREPAQGSGAASLGTATVA